MSTITSWYVCNRCLFSLSVEEKMKLALSRVLAAILNSLIPACCKLRGLLVRGLEPRLRKSGSRKFLGGSDHSPKIIK